MALAELGLNLAVVATHGLGLGSAAEIPPTPKADDCVTVFGTHPHKELDHGNDKKVSIDDSIVDGEEKGILASVDGKTIAQGKDKINFKFDGSNVDVSSTPFTNDMNANSNKVERLAIVVCETRVPPTAAQSPGTWFNPQPRG